MLNEKQQELFRIILDENHNMLHGETPTKKMEALGKLTQAKIDLKKDMGEEAYNNFMEQGRKLFAEKEQPRKTTDDGDDFLDDED
jgi:hypothetical protein